MMVPKKSLFLAGAALICLAAAPNAQKTGKRGPLYKRTNEVLRPVSLNLDTGVYTRGPKVQNRNFATASALNNNDFSGFVGVDTGTGGGGLNPCQWWSQGDKDGGTQAQRAGGQTGLMAGFRFAYCSAALDPASGGPGGTVVIKFRESYVKGTLANAGGESGVERGAFTLSGLPANTAASSFFGGFNCFAIPISLGSAGPLCYGGDGSGDDPTVAWSWRFNDVGTDLVLAATWPFISCVASCTNGPGSLSSSRPPTAPGNGKDGTGMEDHVDQYCPAGTILHSFAFGTTAFGGYFTSISMDVREQIIQTFAQTILPGLPNKNALGPAPLVITGAPAMGIAATVSWSMDCSVSTTCTKLAVFRIGFFQVALSLLKWGGVGVPLAGPAGVNLIVGAHGCSPTVSSGFLPGAPKDFAFACAPYSFQGICGENPVGFTSDYTNGNIEFIGIK